MSSVAERLSVIQREQNPFIDTKKSAAKVSLEAEIGKLKQEGLIEAKKALDFIGVSGLSTTLYDIDNDLLGKRGIISKRTYSDYLILHQNPSLEYEANFSLSWNKGLFLPKNYTLFVDIKGDLYKTEKINEKTYPVRDISIGLLDGKEDNDLYAVYPDNLLNFENPSKEELLNLRKWAIENFTIFFKRKEKERGKIY